MTTRALMILMTLGGSGIGCTQEPSDAQLAQRWVQIESCAGGPPQTLAWDGVLEHSASDSEITALDLSWYGKPFPNVELQTLSAPLRAELDALIRWGQAPRFSPGFEHQTPQTMRVLDRLRMVLATANADSVDRAKGVLKVAQQLRTRGTLLIHTVGVYVTGDVARWAKSHGVKPWAELRAAAPSAQALKQAMARDALWSIGMLRTDPKMAKLLPMSPKEWQLHQYATLRPICVAQPTFDALRTALRKPQDSDPKVARDELSSYASIIDRAKRQAAEYAELMRR